ncbi:MAG: hypothetical protein QNL62_06065 [Gammaproteobacteria bacterium]|nr:hypothetical protein [Gammaproteobacteria bacterium]
MPLDASSKGISINSPSTKIAGSFSSYDYNVVDQSSTEFLDKGDKVLVSLNTAPKEVKRINVSKAGITTVSCHRVDVNKVVDEPTMTHPNNATISSFIDTRFAVGVNDDIDISVGDISDLIVRSYPTGLRFGLVTLPGVLTDSVPDVFFWQAPGEHKTDIEFSIEKEFNEALQQKLDAYFKSENYDPNAAHIDLAVVVESDNPCKLNVTTLSIDYNVVFFPKLMGWKLKTGLLEIVDKLVLRYPEKNIETKRITFDVPASATSVILKLDASFSKNAAAIPEEGLPKTYQHIKTGFLVESDTWIAQRIDVADPQVIKGFMLALMPVGDNIEMICELQTDFQNKPSGESVFSVTKALSTAKKQQPVQFIPQNPVTLQPQPYWLMIKTTGKNAIWLAQPVSAPAMLMQQKEPQNIWTEIELKTTIEAISIVIENNLASTALPYKISINGVSSHITPDVQGFCDLSLDIQNYIQSQLNPAQSVSIPVDFTAAGPGLITIYSPEIK